MRTRAVISLLLMLSIAHAVQLDVLLHPAFGDSARAADSLLAHRGAGDVPLFCAGRILAADVHSDTTLSPAAADSLLLAWLDTAQCIWASPQEYRWRVADKRILASNIDAPWGRSAVVVAGDSLRLGVLALYSPDTDVRYPSGTHARYLYDLPVVLDAAIAELQPQCDLILLTTNLPLHVLEELLKGAPLDGVVSFDYMPTHKSTVVGIPYFAASSGPLLWRIRSEVIDGRAVLQGERITP